MKSNQTLLWSAAAVGLIISLPAVSQLLLAFSNELVALADRAEHSDTLGQFQVWLAMLPLNEAAEAAGEELKTISARVSTVSLLLHNQMLVIAGVLAAAGIVTARLIDE